MDEGVIKYDSASAVWQLSSDGSSFEDIATVTYVDGQSIAQLDDVGDVNISSATSGDFLKWNGSAWVNDQINLGTDTAGNYVVDVVAGAGIGVLHASPSSSAVVTVELDAGIGGLKDVYVDFPYFPADGQFLQYSTSLTGWTPASIPAINNLDDVGDVTITTAESGDFLKWNGSAWVNDPIDLGTDTVGNFISDVAAGTGVTISHTPSEGSTASIAIGQDVATSASVEFALVTVNNAPTQSGHLTNKQYVDGLAAGINWHNSVELTTDAILPNTPTYNNGADGVGATLTGSTNIRLVVDGFNATTGTRILVKNQSNAAHNGIYDVTEQGSVSGAWVLTRSSDYDGLNDNVVQGDAVFTVSGSTNSNQGFILTSNGTGTNKKHLLGVDELTFTQFTGTSTILAGSGISKTGNTLSVDSTVATLTGAQTLTNKTLTSPTITGVSPTITLSGDLSGSATFTNLGNATLTASIEPNSVVLGTDTTGDYVSGITAGTGVTVTHTPGEGSTASIAIGQSVATSANVQFANITATGLLNVTASSGDEGGELRLAKPASNTTLAGAVSVDIYQNKLRFFENGGTSRGFYIDLTSGGSNAGTDLAAGGASALDDLTNVTAPSPSTGDFLKWNGSAWVNDAIDLGTDTTGNYVSGVAGGTGVTITHTPGEGSTASVAIGQDVATSASVTFARLTTTGDVTIGGDLTINGTTTTVNTATLNVSDNIIVLNNDVTSTPTENAGIEVERGTSANVLVRWNETSDKWEITNDGTTYGHIVSTADSGTVTSAMISNGTIVDADISASAAIQLSKLATSTAGNIIVYNASGVPTSVTETGDVTIDSSGVTSIASGVIVNADISSTAAIDLGKLADISTNAQGGSYTLVLADKNKIVEMNVGSANNLTVPLNSSVAYPVGTQINILQTGAGQTTVVATGGVTINGTPGLKLRTQWSYATLIKRGTDTWVLVGDLSA
jgi:hypothetical protein